MLVKSIVSAAPSNPTDSLFFRAQVAGCEDCATFIGDYNNISYGNDGVANMVWTDMSRHVPAADGFAQSIFFRRQESPRPHPEDRTESPPGSVR